MVGLHDTDEDGVEGNHPQPDEDHLPGQAREYGGGEQPDEQDDDGAQVGLAEYEEDGHGDGHYKRDHEMLELEKAAAVPGHEAAHGKHRGDFRELGGLERHAADDDGALRAQDLGAEAYLRGHEQQRCDHPQAGEEKRMRPKRVGDAGEENAKRYAYEEEDRLAAHVESRVAGVAVGLHRGGGIDHDQPDDAQKHHRSDEEQARHHDLCRGAHEARNTFPGSRAARGLGRGGGCG